jgi:hypothetical protein
MAASPAGPQGVAAIVLHGHGISARWDFPEGRVVPELSILTTARGYDQPYEWSLHEIEAMSVGVEPAVIDVVKHMKPVTGVPPKQAAIILFARELYGKHKVSPETYAHAVSVIGKRELVDILEVMAGYASTATNLTAGNQWMPPQMIQFLPLPFTPPNDILPDSRSRIPAVNPNPAPPQGGGGGEGAPGGLYRRTISLPPTGPGLMGRFAAGLKSLEANQGKALISLAVLVTARQHDQQYDWTMNEPIALSNGLSPATIDIVRNRKPTTGLNEKEAAIIDLGRELSGQHYITAGTWARALKIFGLRDLSDIVTNVMAPHAREATLLTAFDQHVPAGTKELLPIP